MKHYALFVIFEKAAKFAIVVCCKLKVALEGLNRKVRNTYPVQRAVRVPGIFASGIAALTMRPSAVRFAAMSAKVLSTRVCFADVSH